MTPFGREREGPVFFNQKSRHTHSLSVKHTRQVSSTLLLFTSYRDSWEERKEREKSGENNCKKRVSVCRNKRGKERKRLFFYYVWRVFCPRICSFALFHLFYILRKSLLPQQRHETCNQISSSSFCGVNKLEGETETANTFILAML